MNEESEQPIDTVLKPSATIRPNEIMPSCDLTVSTIAEYDLAVNKINGTKKPPANKNSIKGNLRPPASSRPITSRPNSQQRPAAPLQRRGVTSMAPSPSLSLRTNKAAIIRRTGSTPVGSVKGKPKPITTLKKVAASPTAPPNTSFKGNDSVLSFIPSGEVDEYGNVLSKIEEERMRLDVELTHCRALQYQLLRARLRKAAEAQSRDVIAQLGALWEETQRLKESSAQKRAEAADVRRQRELHMATKLGGAVNISEDGQKASTPLYAAGTKKPNSSRKGLKASASKIAEKNQEPTPDLRAVCESLGPVMKDLSLVAKSVDKTRHALPMKDVTGASQSQLLSAFRHFEGALLEMPKMAKLASTTNSAVGENIKFFRESTETLGRECIETAETLQASGEMACHLLALRQCERLKAKESL